MPPSEPHPARPPVAARRELALWQVYLAQQRSRQDFVLGLLGGVAGAVVGAAWWAFLTVFTKVGLAWMAVILGVLVGLGVRQLGRGIDRKFGFLGALLSLVGCLVGKILTVAIFMGDLDGLPYSQELLILLSDPLLLAKLIMATTHPLDLLFYAVALMEGYWLAFFPAFAADLSEFDPNASR